MSEKKNNINEDKYVEVNEDLVRKNIFKGNKCLTLDYGYRYDGIINKLVKEDDGEYVYINFGDKETYRSNFTNSLNEKMKISDLAYWVCEKENYYDIHAEFVPPF